MSIRSYALYLRSAALVVGLAVSGSAAFAADMPVKAAPAAMPFFLVNDNSVSFTYFPGSTDPGVTSYNPRYQFDMTHFDVNRWGTNFIDFNYQQYGNKDPIQSMYGSKGSGEADALVRNTLSGNAFLGKNFFSNYFYKDISLAYGGFFNVVDNFLSPHTHQFDIGAQFALNLPGTVNFSVYAQKETHNNTFNAICIGGLFSAANGQAGVNGPNGGGACQTGNQEYKWVPHLELAIIEPLTFIPWVPLTFNSFTAVNFPKGTGYGQGHLTQEMPGCPTGGNNPNNPCSAESKTEVFSENRIVLDVGKLYWNKAGLWETYVGYRYWYNKFGTDHNAALFSVLAPNTSIESTAFVGTTYHFTN
jgi:hypothetical protein